MRRSGETVKQAVIKILFFNLTSIPWKRQQRRVRGARVLEYRVVVLHRIPRVRADNCTSH